MRFEKSSYQPTRRSVSGFTLVELIVVIIIIAVIAAIIFPVVKGALERSRQSTSISNLSQIGQALAKYQLDHDGQSPPVLFGYAGAGGTLNGGYTAAQKAGTEPQNFPGLYPSYIKDTSVFVDPDNQLPDDTSAATVNVLCPSSQDPGDCTSIADGTLVAATLQPSYYNLDSYDFSPEVTGLQSIDTSVLVPRYQTSWTSLDSTYQLRLPHPNGNTYVTSTTYHVNHTGIILVLFEDGSVHTVPTEQLHNLGGDVTSIGAPALSGASPSHIWRLLPEGGGQ